MEDYYEYLDSNGVTTLYKLIKDDTVALIDSYSVTINGITTNLDNHVNNTDIHTPVADIEGMIDTAIGSLNFATPDYVDTKVAELVNSAPETLNTLKELSDALGNDTNFATTVANQIGSKADKDSVYTKLETDTLLEGKANSVHTHVVSDITDFPTIPTKTSQLINDSGFLTGSNGLITSVSWSDITDKPNFSTVATSGSYTDLVDTPTIPTKTSELTNDSGYITSVSWEDVTSKPELSQVAISGSYSDLSNTPTIPTKVSQLENDMGFGTGGDTSDCVHKTGNETINGTKTFTVGPIVSNNATTNGYFIKLNTIARNEIPTQLYHATFRALDKNSKILGEYCIEKSTTGCSLLNMNVRSEDSNGKQLSESLVLNMSNDGSLVRFYPSSNNKMDLGMSNNKWAKVYSDDVVHTSGDETINGIKTFTSSINLKNNNIDLTVTPSSTLTSNFIFKDKNDQNVSFIQYAKRDVEPDILGLYIYDKDKNLHGLQITSNNYVLPRGNNTYSLGSPNNKWTKVYSTNTITYSVTNHDNTSSMTVSGGSSWDKGSTLFLYGDSHSKHPGAFNLTAKNTTNTSQLIGFPNGTLTWGGKSLAIDENLVHRTGNETIGGDKAFSNTIFRKADITTSTVETVYTFTDTNAKPCGSIYNRMHWYNNNIHNRHQSYNATSGKDMYFEVLSANDGSGVVNTGGSVTNNKNLTTVTNATGNSYVATMGWVNNPATSTNVVHRSGDETIGGTKTFSSKIVGNLQGNADTATSANSATYATTQATTDNSTKIATTAWVRTYVESVAGNNTVGSSVSAYWSNSSNVTATGQTSATNGYYPSGYSDYITKTPVVGTIYSGAQLYTRLDAYANATGQVLSSGQYNTHITSVTAQATFSNPISSTGKYLCTTANTVRFRGYAPGGNSVGTASVVENSSTKSIFIRIE